MKAACCVIVGVLVGFGCGSDPGKAEEGGNAAGAAGVAAPAVTAGTTSGASGTGSGAAGASGSVAGAAASGTGGAAAGRSGGAAGARAGTGATAGSTSTAGTGGGGAPAAGGGGGGTGGAAGNTAPATTEKFSFFVTSLAGMRMLSKNDQGFGGDLRYGESTGLTGADKICTELAEKSMPGAGPKGWRAFLSTAKGGANDGPLHARDRIGQGPWYDRQGRLVAMTLDDMLQQRPRGADPAIINDLPNENGVPNHLDTVPGEDDNHDTVTGSNSMGMYDGTPTCNDWTSTETPGAMGTAGTGATGMAGRSGGRGGMMGGRSNGPRIGHSWPAGSGMHWIAAHQAPGCAPSVALVQMGGGSGVGIGNGGGYGGFYCFALKP